MNEKFYTLPPEKQQAIINGGFRVFSQNSYKKSPVSEIAAEAGISKALLFHYFQNKRELYLFLWETCGKRSQEYMDRYRCYESEDLFEVIRRSLRAKVMMMKEYPFLTAFSARAFYEKDPAVCDAIQSSYRRTIDRQVEAVLRKYDARQFRQGLDVQQMYRLMCWAMEGFLWEKLQQGPLVPEELEREYEKMLRFWQELCGVSNEEERE